MASVRLDGIRKVYDNSFVAVHDASFEVRDGEFVVLVGPSGCGKSTTLRMIAGLESITAGELRIGDRLVNDVPSSERDIAMVFQNYALYPHMTVYENMAFALRLRNESKTEIDRRVREAADILDIRAILGSRPRQLSGGQRQRVAVGRAIVRHPQVFLFDEPLSNLDAKLRVQTRKEIARLHRQLDATMIYVTHDQVEAMTMGDRIVVMSAGHIQQIGAPLELYESPANQFVAGFIGSPAMNFVDGTLEEHDGTVTVVAMDGGLRVPLPPGARKHLAGLADGRLGIGIRPEDLYLEGSGPADVVRTEVTVDAVEPMGNEVFVYASAGSTELVARVAPDRLPRVDERLAIAMDRGRLHYFDPTSGSAIAGLRAVADTAPAMQPQPPGSA
ncbi:MAG TPA: sn-glycerol-3-phosphate ABC transporter ATP-binding protein UgpC [Longimicrobiales bacterium]|nr:sn-glycerol-3-phosphate ABC transporter ATP-binding protein UgpC [Longimicrobiales bacterium]